MSFQFFRRFFYEIHLWLGIVSGIVLFLVCLSGTIYVFHEEAQHIAEPAKYYVNAPEGKAALSVDELIAKVEAAKPGMKVASVTIPEKANRTVSMNLSPQNQGERSGFHGERGNRGEGRGEHGGRSRRESGRGEHLAGTPAHRGEHSVGTPSHEGNRGPQGAPPQRSGGHGGGRRGNTAYVNPYTGEIAGEGANVVDPFFMSMFRLHRFLWFSGEWRGVGKMIVGIATLVFVVICLTGIVLWLPRTWNSFARWKAWKPGFRIRFRKGLWPFLYDTHNTVGFYLLVPVLLLALTGLCWSFQWYKNGASRILGEDVFKGRSFRAETIESIENPTKALSVSEMIARQNELTPGPGEISVSIPQDNKTAMVIQKGQTGFFALAMKDRTQWDRFRGTVIPVEHYGKMVAVERFADKPLGAKIAGSVRAIHFGNITGLSSKIFFFIVCLFATSWPITGVLLWTKKLRTKYRKRKAIVEQQSVNVSSGALSVVHSKEKDSENSPLGLGQTV